MSMNMALRVLLTQNIARLCNTALCRNTSSTTFFFLGERHDFPKAIHGRGHGFLLRQQLCSFSSSATRRTVARVGQCATCPSWPVYLAGPASALHGGYRHGNRNLLAPGLRRKRNAHTRCQQQRQRRDDSLGSPYVGGLTTKPRTYMVSGLYFSYDEQLSHTFAPGSTWTLAFPNTSYL
jgi:hypothetical protein